MSPRTHLVPTSRKSKSVAVAPSIADQNTLLLREIANGITTTEVNGYASLVNFVPTSDQPIHRWFRYREGFSIELVKNLIRDLPRGSVILDPFCGCGSTLLAAQELGYESYGFDVNPLSVLVSTVKTRFYSEIEKNQIVEARSAAQSLKVNSHADAPPQLEIIDKIFHHKVLHSLLVLRHFIKSVGSKSVREFLLLAWLSILEDISNVYKEGNGIKYRNRKRLPNGYVTISNEQWQRGLFPNDKHELVLSRFDSQLGMMIEDLRERPGRAAKAYVIEASADRLTDHLPENSVAFSVFSPPYCNCFNYFKMFKVELWMGEFVKSYKDMQTLNRRALRSHVETVLVREGDQRLPEVESFVELIDEKNLWDKRIPNAVRGYFIDMRRVFRQISNVTKPSGKCVAVVGNSAYGGILIPTDLLLAKVANKEGFEISMVSVARHLTTSSQQRLALRGRHDYLRESVVFLEKPDPRLVDKDLTYVGELPLRSEQLAARVFVIKNMGLTSLTHKFHRYPGKFIPHIPRWALSKHLNDSREKIVLDPFCGSGTTLVEAMLLGHRAYGIDIDPIARLVSKVKTTCIPENELRSCVNAVASEVRRRRNGSFRPSISTLNHWFSQSAIEELSAIREVVEQYLDKPELYRFLLVCFISVIRRASNADNQTQKTYVSHTKIKKPPSARTLFLDCLDDYTERVLNFSRNVPKGGRGIILPFGDSRNLSLLWNKYHFPKVDLVITSPPYVKSVDYIYNQMAEYFWIGDLFDLDTQRKQNTYKRNYIGTQKLSHPEYKTLPTTGIVSVDTVARKVFKKNRKNGVIVTRFFLDMRSHFEQLTKILQADASVVFVVGDSLVSGEPIEVHRLIQDCAASSGFAIDNIFGYEIRNRHMRFPRNGRGGIVRYDWVVDLRWKGANG